MDLGNFFVLIIPPRGKLPQAYACSYRGPDGIEWASTWSYDDAAKFSSINDAKFFAVRYSVPVLAILEVNVKFVCSLP